MQKHGYKKKLAGTPLSAYPPSSFSFSWTFGCVGDAEIFCTPADASLDEHNPAEPT
jgi:hypothetical protein